MPTWSRQNRPAPAYGLMNTLPFGFANSWDTRSIASDNGITAVTSVFQRPSAKRP